MPNVIRQIARDDEFGTQSIRIIMTSNDRGPQGEPGEPGEAATIEAGQAYSVEPGQSPAVMNTGTPNAAVFDFYIPKGEKGDRGEPGPAGADEWGEITGNIADQTDLQNALNGKQNKLTAGSNITISGNTISATNTTYTAGNGLNLNNSEFSVNTGTIQEKLTAGTNVDITGNTISATDTTYTAGTGLDLNGTEFSVDTDTIQSKLTAGSNVQINGNTISATDTTYTAGNAITIDSGNNNAINAAIEPADFFTNTNATVSGTGTNITLTPTAGLKISNVQLKGDTTQQTYSGKNLTTFPYYHSSGRVSQGITFTVNNDGSITLNGQNNNQGASTFYFINTSTPISAGTYYCVPTGSSAIYTMNAGNWYNFKASNNYSATIPSNTNIQEFYLEILKGDTTVFDNFTIYPMLTTMPNPTVADYEPYVGGIPAPNPDYPQTVNTVTGRQVVTISDGGSQSQSYEVNLGKNLFDYNSADQGYIGSSGQFISNQTAMTSTYIEVEPGAAYTASANITYRYIGICEYASDKTFIHKVQENVSSLTVTMSPTTRYIRVYYNQSTNVDVSTLITTQAQIEKGSATTYAPYISHFGKNIYPNQIYKTGYVIANDGSEAASTGGCISEAFGIESGETYTLSWQTSKAESALRLAYYASDMTFIRRDSIATTDPLVSTAPNNAVYARLSYYNAEVSWIQLEQGSTATPYQPFIGGQLELCKIGTYQDYIYKSGDDWYVRKEIVKISPDGTESWNSLSISNPNYIYCYTSAFDNQVKSRVWDGLFSDKFSVYDYSGGGYKWISPSATIKGACFSNGDNNQNPINLRIICPKTTADSLANFKTWLGTSRPVFYYPLATATDIQITDSSVVAQLEALLAANSYDPTTVFTASSEYLPAVLSVSTLRKSLAGVLEAIRRQ